VTNCDRPDVPAENPALAVTQGSEAELAGKGPEETAVEVPEHEGGTGHPVNLDPALLAELREVTDEPARAIDTAVRQWLQRRAIKESDTSRPLPVNPFVPPRGEWND
jgi:CTP:molybdopterin cytidylyltransferase MocA